MKRFIYSILFLFVTSSLYAIDLSSLNSEQLNIYNHEALFIDTKSVTEGNSLQKNFMGDSYYYTYSEKTKQVWQPFKGTNKITKYDFFKITNNEVEAIKVKNAIDSNNKYTTMGYAVLGVSSAAIIGGALYGFLSENSNLSNGHVVAGYTIAGVGVLGALLSYIPLKHLQIDINDLFNVNFAISIADGYNARLLKSIANNAQ